MPSRNWTSSLLLTFLAVVFSIGLTFASVELPNLLHGVLASTLPSNEGDSHADDAALLRTELFMQHYHLRAVGYLCFGLMVLLHGPGSTRRSAAVALGRIGSPDAVQPLIAALDETDPRTRSTLIYALGELADERAVDPLLAILKRDDPEVDVRRAIMVAFGQISTDRTADALRTALADEDAEVRLYAEEALTAIQVSNDD